MFWRRRRVVVVVFHRLVTARCWMAIHGTRNSQTFLSKLTHDLLACYGCLQPLSRNKRKKPSSCGLLLLWLVVEMIFFFFFRHVGPCGCHDTDENYPIPFCTWISDQHWQPCIYQPIHKRSHRVDHWKKYCLVLAMVVVFPFGNLHSRVLRVSRPSWEWNYRYCFYYSNSP